MTLPSQSPERARVWVAAGVLLVVQALFASVVLRSLASGRPALYAPVAAVDILTLVVAGILAVGLVRRRTWAWGCTLLFAGARFGWRVFVLGMGYALHHTGLPSVTGILSLVLLLAVLLCLAAVFPTID